MSTNLSRGRNRTDTFRRRFLSTLLLRLTSHPFPPSVFSQAGPMISGAVVHPSFLSALMGLM